jgi:hypothetical protein
MARYLTNAFSLNMVPGRFIAAVEPISLPAARRLVVAEGVTNAIGHADTDTVIRNLLGVSQLEKGERVSLSLQAGDELVVAQYRGPRLSEGATTLPEGAAIEFAFVKLIPALGPEERLNGYADSPLGGAEDAETALHYAGWAGEMGGQIPPAYERVGSELIRTFFQVREAEETS